jgi:hypothetical protein
MTTRRLFLAGAASAAVASPAPAAPVAAPSVDAELLAAAERFDATHAAWRAAEQALADAVEIMRPMVPARSEELYLKGAQSIVAACMWQHEDDLDGSPIYQPNGRQRKVFSGPLIREYLAQDRAVGRFRQQLEDMAAVAEVYEGAVTRARAAVGYEDLACRAYWLKIDVGKAAQELIELPAKSLPGLIAKGRAVRGLCPSGIEHAWARRTLTESLAEDVVAMAG